MLSLIILCLSCDTSTNSIDIKYNSTHQGKYCYIIWTSDSTKCNPNFSSTFELDSNGVVYVHQSFKKQNKKIRILDQNNKDKSDKMMSIMGNEAELSFYCPTDEEMINHPNYDQYYEDKLIRKKYGKIPGYKIFELEKLGYKFEYNLK